ncbi:MAG: hypothetical protein CFE31_04145 [Rhizobiales bacterium PAR1]|nr:MAG: hypothetical protein CFE31_04145 [Rhizobiales bacterium PAR1]
MIDQKDPAEIVAATEAVKAASEDETKQDKVSAVVDTADLVGTAFLDGAADVAVTVAGAAVEGVGTLATGAVEVVGTILGGLLDL